MFDHHLFSIFIVLTKITSKKKKKKKEKKKKKKKKKEEKNSINYLFNLEPMTIVEWCNTSMMLIEE